MSEQKQVYAGPSLTVWTNAKLSADLADRLSAALRPHRLVISDVAHSSNLVAGSADPGCRAADVAFGQPAVDDVIASASLRWIHLTTAGYTRYDREDVWTALAARGATMTNSSGVYANPCAQHVLALMLAHDRCLADAMRTQIGDKRWAYRELRPRVSVLDGQRVLIVGFGAIGRRLVQLLAPYQVEIAAVRRHARGDEPVPTHPLADLDRLLGDADHVVNLLPSAAGNERLFREERFARMKPSAAFYNVGRGDTVDQAALIAALNDGRLAAAYLDVTTPEPLPADSPLWTARNCVITPHVAGGAQDELRRLVEHFARNFDRFQRGEPLADRITP